MMPAIDTVTTDEDLPQRAAIVVIGGGIIGVSAALHLARKGVDVVLCEKGRIGREQSGRNWGWVRAMGRDLAEIPLSLESQRFWGEMDRLCEAETGYRRCGILNLCETEVQLTAQRAWLDEASQYQVASKVLGPGELGDLVPKATRSFAGALITPTDGRAEPQKATPAMAAAARRFGARILEGCAVRGLDLAAGRVAGVITEKGRIACDGAILAGGAWSRLFCGNEGLDLPQLKVLGSVFATQPLPGGPETTVGGGDFAFRKRLDGGYTVARRNASISHITPDSFRLFFDFLPSLVKGWEELRLRPFGRFLEEWRMPRRWRLDEASPFEAVRVLDPEPDLPQLEEAKGKIKALFPFFSEIRMKDAWGGVIDVTPDAVPVISEVAQLPGLVIATGFSGHGFGIGPGSGKLAAELATKSTPSVDPTPFRLQRFKRATSLARPL